MTEELRAILNEEWGRLSYLLEPALADAGGLHTLESIKERIDDDRAQLWPGRDSVIVTEIDTYPNGRVLNFWLCGGKLDEVLRMSRRICRWAAEEEGIDRARLTGRLGWERVDPDWQKVAIVMERKLR